MALLLFLIFKEIKIREKGLMLLFRRVVGYHRDSFKSSYSRIQRRTEWRRIRWWQADMVRVGYISCLSVVDQSDYNNVENEKFQVVKTSNRGRTQKSITRKSDGRKSSAPKKLSVLEDEKVGEKSGESLDGTRYSILGSYLNSCKTHGQSLSTNTFPSQTPEVTHGKTGMDRLKMSVW